MSPFWRDVFGLASGFLIVVVVAISGVLGVSLLTYLFGTAGFVGGIVLLAFGVGLAIAIAGRT